jgi:hypothetical protein
MTVTRSSNDDVDVDGVVRQTRATSPATQRNTQRQNTSLVQTSASSTTCSSEPQTQVDSKESQTSAAALTALSVIWSLSAGVAVITAFVMGFKGKGTIGYKLLGIFIAFCFGPFYFIYLAVMISTRTLVFSLRPGEIECLKLSKMTTPEVCGVPAPA